MKLSTCLVKMFFKIFLVIDVCLILSSDASLKLSLPNLSQVKANTLVKFFCVLPEDIWLPTVNCAYQGENKKFLSQWLDCGKSPSVQVVADHICSSVMKGDTSYEDYYSQCADGKFTTNDLISQLTALQSCATNLAKNAANEVVGGLDF